ncbi:uncharacterized protein LOC113512929 isoform X2 [Galleria mellonella]|nr:uncharacterized protein LOC113512929 isoform X2 [Galleria mellonella]XP_031766916.2 uncharacterized protein LOC113512929 isoform X2 [Galleria mellonella]
MGVSVPYVTSFCCCLNLEVGAKIVGYLHLVASLILTILSAWITSGIYDNISTVEDAGDHVYSRAYPIALAATIASIAHVLLALFLLLSAYKRWCNGLRSWVWIMVALWVAGLLYIVVSSALSGFVDSGSDIFLAFALGVVFFVVVGYCIITVNSYYLMLKSSEDMEGPAKIDY